MQNESQSHYNFVVDENLANLRLDKGISLKAELSRTRIQELIEQGFALVDNVVVNKCAYKLSLGEMVKIVVPPVEIPTMKPSDIEINIVYEDDHMMVIDKQAGLVVHPGAGNIDNTLANALLSHCSDTLSGIGGVARPGIVHRLDKDTSGLMVVAKTDEAHISLSTQIERRQLKRTYQALIWGLPSPVEGVVEFNIGRSRTDRTKMMVVKSGGKTAKTYYAIEKVFCAGAVTLVRCMLDTGRTHQIRVHMSYIGHSVLGDQVYGHNRRKVNKYMSEAQKNAILGFNRQALHSCSIEFKHPVSKEMMKFESKLPDDIAAVIKILEDR